MDTLITTAENQFASTTGFAIGDLVSFSGDQLRVMLGMGLGLVEAVLPWVIALVAIGVIVGLIYHGLRLLHFVR